MPKIKNEKKENMCPNKKIPSKNIYKVTPYKFDAKQILKERKAQAKFWEKSAELDKKMKVVDELYQKEVNQMNQNENEYGNIKNPPKIDYIVFDSSKYNINFEKYLCSTPESCLKQLFRMSIEENVLKATTHFYNLRKVNWSPSFIDFENVLINWGTEIDTLMNKPLLKCEIYDESKINRHNFELVFDYISESIQKSNNKFTDNDLLLLAKFAVTIYFDYHLGPMKNTIKRLFSACIKTALHDDTDILCFSQELYAKYTEDQVLKIVGELFLPLEGKIMKQIYTYLTFKVYKSLLGKNNNLTAFPSSLNDWFVQDVVNLDYFRQNTKKYLLQNVIKILEHIVVVFDLYKDEDKLSDMYDFLYILVNPNGLSMSSQNLTNILDHWKLELFRFHVLKRQNMIY